MNKLWILYNFNFLFLPYESYQNKFRICYEKRCEPTTTLPNSFTLFYFSFFDNPTEIVPKGFSNSPKYLVIQFRCPSVDWIACFQF